jgi:acyl carrier protein
MTTDQFLIHLDEILNRSEGTTKRGETLAATEGWDSLAMLGLIALADSDLDLRLTGKQLMAAKTIDDLIAMVAEKLS